MKPLSRQSGLPPKAVIYARFSSHNQREESIEQQVAECRAYAAANDLDVIRIYHDSAKTAAMAIIGAFIGAQINERLSDAAFRVVLLILVPAIALLMALHHNAPDRALPMTGKRLALCALIGLLVGAYDGFFGPGTGVLLILGFTWAAGMDTVTASGSSKVVNLASNVSALVAHFLNGNIVFALAVPAMACSAIGGYIGSWLAIRKGARFIRWVMMGVTVLLLVKLVVDYL